MTLRRTALFLLLLTGPVLAGNPKPVPLMQVVPQPDSQISFQRDGVELTRMFFSPALKRPFLFPLNGPSGRSVTRMGHPHDPEGHSHHNSVWISHEKIGDGNFWLDRGNGRVVHQRVLRMEDSDERALVETESHWRVDETRTLLHEKRRVTVRPATDGAWWLLLDLEFSPAGSEAVNLGETAFGFIGVRMAKTIGVRDGGGTIRNSEGGVDEKGCFRLPARWVDYEGPATQTATEGILLCDHPSNPGHPVPFHVRDDGWMGATQTFTGTRSLAPGETLRLRYGLFVHGKLSADALQQRWLEFAAMQPEPWPVQKK